MKTIHQLPQQVISKIAAGEVIECPAYAVKELVENAIDAKADSIIIHIEEAGLKKISVTDNGIGMSREDSIASVKPHTTSKLFTEDDLVGVTSLGFRGEALSSISAISNITIRSRINTESEGMELIVKEGTIAKISPVGIPLGTTIIVDQLFHNVPVRKKFLKSNAKEFRHIVEIVMQHALAFPNIRFFLTHNKKILLDLPKAKNIDDRIKLVLGKDMFEQLVSISTNDSYLTIEGYLAKPQLITATSSRQFIFVNNRRIHDKFIATAVKDAYGNLLAQSANPIFILFLTMPFEIVDVNVHPRKDQVNFLDRKLMVELIQKNIQQTLETQHITYRTSRWKEDPLYNDKTKRLFSPKTGSTNSFAGKLLKDSVTPWDSRADTVNTHAPIQQLHNLYIFAQTISGLIMIDQHAAHERILFEQYSKAFQTKKQLFEPYLLPQSITIELSISDGELLREYEKILGTLGINISHFQANTYLISTIPEFLKDRNIQTYLLELLDTLSEEKKMNILDTQTKKMLAYLACRSAIKAGTTLTKNQMQELIKKLEETKNNTACPHGRPTKILVSLAEINRLFKR